MIIFLSVIAISVDDNIALNCTLPTSNVARVGHELPIPLIHRNKAGIYTCRNITPAEEEHSGTVQRKCVCFAFFVTVGQTDRSASLVGTDCNPILKLKLKQTESRIVINCLLIRCY